MHKLLQSRSRRSHDILSARNTGRSRPHLAPDEGHKRRQALADLIPLYHACTPFSPVEHTPHRFLNDSNSFTDNISSSQHRYVSPFTRHTVGRSFYSSYTNFKSKVVPRSAVNPDFLEPFNCKGLFTTTHAITHRPHKEPLVAVRVGHWAKCEGPPVGFSSLPDRNSGPGLIGIGLVWGLRTLYSDISYYFKSKVVPRSAVNPDFLEPFNCKGLFTTTHAITHRPHNEPLVSVRAGHQAKLLKATQWLGWIAGSQLRARFDWHWPVPGVANSFL